MEFLWTLLTAYWWVAVVAVAALVVAVRLRRH
jgi:hypothetical protein